jgi:hypothetical protein
MKLRPLALTMLAGLSFSVTSCIQSDSENALNSDGSGKFTIKATLDMGPLMGLMQAGGGEGAPDMGDPGKEMLLGVLGSTKGVDVWKDAKTTKGADGKIVISASGYFKDITKFEAGNPMESMGAAAGGGGESSSSGGFGQMKSSKDKDGNWIVELPMSSADADGDAKAAPAEPAEKLSKEEIADKVKEMRTQFGAMKPMMQSMMGGMKISQSIKVGGTIKDYGLFTKVDESTAKLEMSFAKMFDGMEKLMADDKLAAKMAEVGGSNPMELLGSSNPEAKEIGEAILKSMFGGSGEPKLVITPGKDAFDYAKESAEAKANQSAELKKLLKDAEAKAKEDGAEEENEAAAPKKKAA